MQRAVHAYRILRSHSALLVGSTPLRALRLSGGATPPQFTSSRIPTEALAIVVTRLQELPAATDEPMRQQVGDEMLSLAVRLHAAGTLKIQNIAHPGLATMISDDLTETVSWRPCSMQL